MGRGCIGSRCPCIANTYLVECVGQRKWIGLHLCSLFYGRRTLWLFARCVFLYSKATTHAITWHYFSGFLPIEPIRLFESIYMFLCLLYSLRLLLPLPIVFRVILMISSTFSVLSLGSSMD
jgi:hypothetical protein